MRWLILLIGFTFSMLTHAQGVLETSINTLNAQPHSTPTPTPVGETYYTWAVSNLNVREQPDVQSAVITRLPYATAVQVLPQTEPAIPFEMTYFNQQNTADSLTQTNTQFPKVVLHGEWLKIKTDEHEGYVFSRFLMKMPPPTQNESSEAYLIRAFELNLLKTDKWVENSYIPDNQNTFMRQYYASPSNNVTFTVIDDEGDAEIYGNGGEIMISDMDFEQAIVFFTVVLPPEQDGGARYEEGKKLEYLLDQIGNTANLKATEQGVSFSWIFGLN